MRRYPSLSEYTGRYNVAEAELEPGEVVHNSDPDIPPLTYDEHMMVWEELVAATSKYGPCNELFMDRADDDYPADHYWIVSDNLYADRTQQFWMYGNCGLSEPLIRDLQAVLQKYPLWRIYVVGGPAGEGKYFAMIYPTVVHYD